MIDFLNYKIKSRQFLLNKIFYNYTKSNLNLSNPISIQIQSRKEFTKLLINNFY